MIIRGEIIGLETTGDGLRVELQGRRKDAAFWRPMEKQTIVIPANEITQKAFHMGRTVDIVVRPR